MGVIITEEKDNELVIRSAKAEELAKKLFPEFIAYLTETRKYTLDFIDYRIFPEKNIISLQIDKIGYKGLLEYQKIISKNDSQNPDYVRTVTIDRAAILEKDSKEKKIQFIRVNNKRIDEYVQIPL